MSTPETENQGGGLGAAAFDLVVVCDAGPFAVVGYAGQKVRGSAGAKVVVLGAGRYNVVFPASVTGCAPIATVGDPAADVVFNPASDVVFNPAGVGPNNRVVERLRPRTPAGGCRRACRSTSGCCAPGPRA